MNLILRDTPLVCSSDGKGQEVVKESHCCKETVAIFRARNPDKGKTVLGAKFLQIAMALGKVLHWEEEVKMTVPQNFAVLPRVGGLGIEEVDVFFCGI